MPSARKQAILAKSRKRQGRGTLYLVLAIVLIAIVGVGVYVYAVSQPQPTIVYAKLNTSMGLIEVELYQSQTPITVNNFVDLAKSGFYNNLTWHRIVKGFVIQVGDPTTRNGGGNRTTWGNTGSDQTIPLELVSSLHNYAGYLGMARSSDLHSGSSQFYINLVDNPSLDTANGGYTVFGKVISGMQYALDIGSVPVTNQYAPAQNEPVNPVFLTSVTISSTA